MRVAIVAVLVGGCFAAGTPAQRAHAIRWNVAEVVVGAVVLAAGIAAARASEPMPGPRPDPEPDLGPYFGGVLAAGGGVMMLGGALGLALVGLGFEPVQNRPPTLAPAAFGAASGANAGSDRP
jgi:hypothetical protein